MFDFAIDLFSAFGIVFITIAGAEALKRFVSYFK